MKSRWREVTLGELEKESGGFIQTGPFGSQLHASDYSAVGTPVVMPTNIRDLRISTDGIARVSKEHVLRLARHRLQPGDIVYSRRGDVEKCALIDDIQVGWLCGTGCLLVRVQGSTVDARCLTYLLSLPATRGWISQHAVGATMPNLNTSVLREVPVTLPPIKEQRGIAATLGALDDKIESNRRLAQWSSQLLSARADALLRAAATHELPLGEVVRFNAVTREPAGATDELVYTDIASVSSGVVDDLDVTTWENAPSRARRGVADGDVIYSTVRPGRRSFAQIIDPDPRIVVSTGFAVMTPSRLIGSSLLTTVAASQEFAAYLESVAHGSAYPAVSIEAMGAFPVILPVDQIVVAAFEQATMPLRRRINQARTESALLVGLRDALLPELLSGRVRVPEAMESVKEATG